MLVLTSHTLGFLPLTIRVTRIAIGAEIKQSSQLRSAPISGLIYSNQTLAMLRILKIWQNYKLLRLMKSWLAPLLTSVNVKEEWNSLMLKFINSFEVIIKLGGFKSEVLNYTF